MKEAEGDLLQELFFASLRAFIRLLLYSFSRHQRDDGSKLFFRYNHYINIKDKTQSFSQMQLGYSINITQVWDEKK